MIGEITEAPSRAAQTNKPMAIAIMRANRPRNQPTVSRAPEQGTGWTGVVVSLLPVARPLAHDQTVSESYGRNRTPAGRRAQLATVVRRVTVVDESGVWLQAAGGSRGEAKRGKPLVHTLVVGG